MEKQCTGCGETKLLSEYHKKKTGKYGRASRCKVCKSLADKKYHQTEVGKATQKAAKKAYRESEKGRAKRKARQKAYSQSEKGKAKRKAYRKVYNHSEAGRATQKIYRKAYSQSEKGKAKRKVYDKNRLQTDPVYKLHKNLSSGFCNWIKGNRKTCRTEQYVGCTYQELLDHLESQFEEGMTWENQGEWHIDHFKTQSRFDPTIEEEKYKCWHYTNLQPMWSSENISWGNKKKPGDEFVIWMDREIGWVNIEDVINKKTKLNLKIEKEEV